MTIVPQAIYRFISTPVKIPMAFFTELEQIIVQFLWKQKRLQISKSVLRKENVADPCLQTILHYYSNPNSMALAQEQTYINGTELRAEK